MKSIYKIFSFLILAFMSIQSVIFTSNKSNILENQNNNLINYNDKEIEKFAEERCFEEIYNYQNDYSDCQYRKDILNKCEEFKNKKIALYEKERLELKEKEVDNIKDIELLEQKFKNKYNFFHSTIIEKLKTNNLSLREPIKIKDDEHQKTEKILCDKYRVIIEEIENLEYELSQSGNQMNDEQKNQLAEKKEEAQSLKTKIKENMINKQNTEIDLVKEIIKEEVNFFNIKLLELKII